MIQCTKIIALLTIYSVLQCAIGLAEPSVPTKADLAIPRYSHIFVIVDENKDYAQILDPRFAPHIAALAKRYGDATEFFGEVHPSEPNYVALVGGDTFGIHDDDGYYCVPGLIDKMCGGAASPGYVRHTIDAPNLATQFAHADITWKGYYESLPAPGSGVTTASDPAFDNGTRKTALYASKHSGFMNFASVQNDPNRAQHLVGFDRLDRDLATGDVPAFALIVPNLCHDMHGMTGPKVPHQCSHDNMPGLIAGGDAMVQSLVERIQASSAWRTSGNSAIIITFDEGDHDVAIGCCGWEPKSRANFGGGHIPTIVITNHGPRSVVDATPYNHYSLLRTIEDAFGIRTYLGHASQTSKGVVPMLPLFMNTK